MWLSLLANKYTGIILLYVVLLGYIGIEKIELKHKNNEIAELTQQKADLQAGISVQNLAINQLSTYNKIKTQQVADAEHLAEKLQDEIDLKAQAIQNQKTTIDQKFTDLKGCRAQLARIKSYMTGAEKEFKK